MSLVLACGPNPDGGGGSGDSDATVSGDGATHSDGTVGWDVESCQSDCDQEGERVCNSMSTKVRECRQVAGGCLRWEVAEDCAAQAMLCSSEGGTVECVVPETCQDGIRNQDESDVDCGGTCEPCPEGAECGGDDDCASGLCRDGHCLLCESGEYRCLGNSLQICSSDGMAWNEQEHCDFFGGEACDADAGQCHRPSAIGNGPSNPTGVYYQFAYFTQENAPIQCNQCVWDVDSLGDLIFVNRGISALDLGVDVYRVTLLDSDGDGVLEPNQHPDNPDNTGPIEERQLTFVTHYSFDLGMQHMNEIYATSDILYWLKGGSPGEGIWSYTIASGATAQVVPPPSNVNWGGAYGVQVLGYDEVRDLWFAATGGRYVVQYDPATTEWSLEFLYPDLAGGHGDGMEVVTDPNTGTPYVYVSDMTSDFIAQYWEDDRGRWTQVNLFHYNQPQAKDVEGMGFGALNHFWMAGRDALYEVGGGDLSRYTEVIDPTHH